MSRARSYEAGDRVRVRDRLGRKVIGVGTVDVAWKVGPGDGVPVQLDGRTKVRRFEPALVELIERRTHAIYPPAPKRRASTKASGSGSSLLYPQPKPTGPHRDPSYLAFVREHPCCGCGAPAWDAHHWSYARGRGIAQKVSDLQTVPLCRPCHDHVHQHGALPDLTRVQTAWRFLSVQRSLLEERLLDTRRLIRETRATEGT